MFRLAFLTLCTVFTPLASTSYTPAPESWVGEKVIVKRNGIKIANTDENGKQVYVGKIAFAVVTVLADKDGRLKVRQQGVEGWFDKDEAILLESAIPYYTDIIKANPNSAYGYAMRGIAYTEKKNYDKAIADHSEAIRLDPKDADCLQQSGLGLQQQNGLRQGHCRFQ
jgi:tetratricopeptide (TPR) repeat protein